MSVIRTGRGIASGGLMNASLPEGYLARRGDGYRCGDLTSDRLLRVVSHRGL